MKATKAFLLEALLEASAEYYSLDLKKKIERGMRESALNGKFVGGAVPWWCSVGTDRKLVVNEERAAIVKEAFARYDSGEGSKSIVDDFAKRGLRSNRGMPVTLSWLLSILKNRKTIGEYTYNGIEIPGGLPAVVDKPLFDRVQGAHRPQAAHRGRRSHVKDGIPAARQAVLRSVRKPNNG